ncbi:MAG: cobalt-precorrin-5B (C(1))-methyltransferase CbiD [Clostridium sp.]|nr:cobalt-precorrin-5B (C(1))-methyltransferase CbiD [Clostridium sp.]
MQDTPPDEKKTLRNGYTTGTCAAAAAAAAAQAFLKTCGGAPETDIFPAATEAVTPGGISLLLEIADHGVKPDGRTYCAVRKDSGDDPDITNGVLVYAEVRKGAPEENAFPRACADPDFPGIFLYGGTGIGIVTKPGLQVPVGEYAINPVPRRQILKAVHEALKEVSDTPLPVTVTVSIPGGEELAKKTFNPRLGIEGGLSVLGTTGIVRPMSEEALLETIRLDIRVKSAGGKTKLAVAPGNYGEAFLRREFGLEAGQFVTCSNYVGETFRMLREEGIGRVLFAGHMGKLIKVSGGILNTHSKYGDHRMELTADCAGEAGADEETRKTILSMNTTEEAAEFLKEKGILEKTLNTAAGRIVNVLENAYGIHTEAIVFTGSGAMGQTPGAAALARELKEEQ